MRIVVYCPQILGLLEGYLLEQPQAVNKDASTCKLNQC